MTTSAYVTGLTEPAEPAEPAEPVTEPAEPAVVAPVAGASGSTGSASGADPAGPGGPGGPVGLVADRAGSADRSAAPGSAGAPAPGQRPDRRPGVFISFEGGDGVGKTTQLTRLAEALSAAGTEVVVTREPGGTELGSDVRRLLLYGGHVDPRAEALLYAADRAHHVATLVRPALACGAVVLTDRYLDSSVAYQGAARSLGPEELRELSLWATGGLLPDLTILLDAEPDLAASRVASRAASHPAGHSDGGPDGSGQADRLEREGAGFRAALREQFLALAASEPDRFAVIDAARPVEEVAEDVTAAVSPLLSSRQAAGEGAVAVHPPAEGPAAGGQPA